MINAIKNITVIIYLFFMCHRRKHRLQITQERSEYDLMTNSVMFMQQMTSALLDGYTSVCK